MRAAATLTLHAGCVVVGTHGIVIRGASGSGKSYLARLILEHCAARNRFAALVADDQVQLFRYETDTGVHLVARPPETLAGLMEVRGLGICRVRHEPAAVVACILDIVGSDQPKTLLERFPLKEECQSTLLGVSLPRLRAQNPHMALDLLVSVLNLKCEQGASNQGMHVINEWFPLAFGPQYGNDKDS